MKALLILSDNVFVTPYLFFYLTFLKQTNIDYRVVYWDKAGSERIDDKKFIRFQYNRHGKLSRLIGYFKFRKKIVSLINRDSFSLIIPLHAQVFAIIVDKLLRKFKRKFIFDVRDYSYEKFYFFRVCQKFLVRNSLINVISSPGYTEFLPRGTYWTCHNIPPNLNGRYKQYNKRTSEEINISYIGSIRFMEQNKKIILFFKNDPRYHINFIGRNASQLKKFCALNHVKNVTLIDSFLPSKTLDYYSQTDIVMNLYGNHTPLLDYALSNKLYYSAFLYKPILVCKDTYMEKIINQYGLGFVLTLTDGNEKNKLYNYYKNLDREKYINKCDYFLAKSITENKKLIEKLKECVDQLKRNDND